MPKLEGNSSSQYNNPFTWSRFLINGNKILQRREEYGLLLESKVTLAIRILERQRQTETNRDKEVLY